MRRPQAERNLLLGVLALQMDFISRDALIAGLHAWVLDKAKALGAILLEQGKIDPEDLGALEAMVDRHVARHGGDPETSLAALPAVGGMSEFVTATTDPNLQYALSLLATRDEAGADDTRSFAPGGPPGSGGRFRKLRDHARGNLGVVFVAHDGELNREVALKEIRRDWADDPISRARFVVEAEVTGGLEHPGIVPVYSLGRYDDGQPFYAMRFIKGDSLKDAIASFHKGGASVRHPGERSLSLQKLLRRFLDVCDAVDYAHSRGILHRDLKPGNIMVGRYGETLVVDWGLAKAVGRSGDDGPAAEATLRPASASGSAATAAGSVVGTPGYMSPEQAAGRIDLLGTASDVYSLGATLYALLTGGSPFVGKEIGDVLRLVRLGEFPRPRELHPWIDPALEAVCLRAMALNPEDRHASARALAEDVERWIADEPVSAYREPLSRRLRRLARRHRTAVASSASVSLVALVLLGGAWAWWSALQRRTEAAARTALVESKRLATEARATSGVAKWREAIAFAKQAQGLLATVRGASPLRHEVDAALAEFSQGERDQRMLLDLDEARLAGAAVRDGHFDAVAKTDGFRWAFRTYGIDVSSLSPDQTAGRIRGSAIRGALIETIEEWAVAESRSTARERLIDLARKVDPSVEADRLRDAIARGDGKEMAKLAARIDIASAAPARLHLVSTTLIQKHEYEAVIALLKPAQRLHPGDFWINHDLGFAYSQAVRPRFDEAVRYFTAALAIRPSSPGVCNNLGNALNSKGEAAEAIAAYRRAIALKHDDAQAHCNLGLSLMSRGEAAEAVVACRHAIAVKPDYAEAYCNLGLSLMSNGEADEAIVAYRRAIALKPDYAEACCNLGRSLMRGGELAQAFQSLRRGHELGSKLPSWRYPSARWVRDCERLMALEARLPAVLRGEDSWKSPVEGVEFARLCRYKRLYGAAARFLQDAFTAQPGLVDGPDGALRYNAACAAALAGSGQGKDDPKPDHAARARLREKAREWLRADLSATAKRVEKPSPKTREAIARTLAHWKADPDLAGIRDEAAVAALPEAERDAWRKLWAEVEALREKAGGAAGK